MTMQAADYVNIRRKKYVLIDVEKDKQIITCANFNMPESNGIISLSTACWRGYTAEYYVVRNNLYGMKCQEIYFEELKKEKTIKSSRVFYSLYRQLYYRVWRCMEL